MLDLGVNVQLILLASQSGGRVVADKEIDEPFHGVMRKRFASVVAHEHAHFLLGAGGGFIGDLEAVQGH